MVLRRLRWLVLLAAAWPAVALAGGQKTCVTADEASLLLNKDVCVTAHIYDVVELPDGTRFLDICTPETSDDKCRFTFVSLRDDRDEVGELRKYRDMDVHVLRSMHGRAGMVVSHARQFYGGPPKFKPNPKAAARFQRRPAAARGQRPQPARARWPPRLHEFAGPGDTATEIAADLEVPSAQCLKTFLPWRTIFQRFKRSHPAAAQNARRFAG